MTSTQFTRRQFVKSAAIGVGAFALAPTAKVLGANEDLRIAHIGLGGRGGQLDSAFGNISGVRVVALCDPDAAHVAKFAKKYPDAFTTQDPREVLERNDVDAIISASTNQWHALLTIWACQAGKHVFIEKPVSHNIFEGVKMTEAARKYNRIVSSGFQNRSDTGLMPFYEKLHNGAYGKVKNIRTLCYRSRKPIGKRDTPLTPPDSVNYDVWLGPAEDQAIMRPRFHYDWHWDFNTGNGDLGNQGPHETDLARWALGDPMSLPEQVECVGGRYWDDAGDTPNMLLTRYLYGGIELTSEVINLNTPRYKGVGVGVIITCENGEFRGGRGGGAVYDSDGNEIERWRGNGNGHYGRFIDAVKNNDPSVLTSEVESAAYSSGLAHVANIAYRIGTSATTDEVRSTFAADADLKESVGRFRDIMSKAGVPQNATWTHGPRLNFDSKAMQFTGQLAAKANPLVTRKYRKGYVVLESV